MAFRVVFWLMYRDDFAAASGAEVALSFLAGLRFDLATILGYTGLPVVLFFMLSPLVLRVRLMWLMFVFIAAMAVPMFLLQGADLFYYREAGRRISFEVLNMLHDWRPILGLAIKAYALQGLITLLGLTGLLALSVWGFRKLAKYPWQPVPWWANALQGLVLLVAVVFAARGGLQTKPLSVDMAFRGSQLALGHLSLNPVFTASKAVWALRFKAYAFLPPDEALAETRALLQLPLRPEVPDFPLMRSNLLPQLAAGTDTGDGAGETTAFSPSDPRLVSALTPTENHTPKNLVILVIESFSAQFSKVLAGEQGRGGKRPQPMMDRFDALAREGLLFSRFYASGTRSIEGVAALLSGYPALPEITLIGSDLSQNQLQTLPGILKARGYNSLFMHGARRGSMWLDAFASRLGFNAYIAQEDFPDSDAISDGTWGVFDHHTLARLHQELEKAEKPVFAFYFSVSSHTPYTLPGESYRTYPEDSPHARLRNSFAYADDALGEFFARARNSSYWKDTLFVITADHNLGGPGLNDVERMWIPLLVLNPGSEAFPRGKVNPVLGSQMDLAPTLLHLLGINAVNNFGGKSLLAPAKRRFALFARAGSGWLEDDRFYVHDLAKPLGAYAVEGGRRLSPLPLAGNEMAFRRFVSYMQTMHNQLINNRVFSPAHARRLSQQSGE